MRPSILPRPWSTPTADTIDIGFEAAARLASGEEVTYDNGGGTSIGGLTSDGGTTKYYVIHAGEGKIKLRHLGRRTPRRAPRST